MSLTRIKKTKKYGRGLYASRNIKVGETVEVSPVIALTKDDAQALSHTLINLYVFDWKESFSALAQRYSDNIAEFCGSWGFVFWFSAGILVWMLVNTYLLICTHFDPYPFILLNLFLTVVSTMQCPIIMMAQNRQVERDREMVQDIHAKLNKIMEKK